jgi:hypothetical protein
VKRVCVPRRPAQSRRHASGQEWQGGLPRSSSSRPFIAAGPLAGGSDSSPVASASKPTFVGHCRSTKQSRASAHPLRGERIMSRALRGLAVVSLFGLFVLASERLPAKAGDPVPAAPAPVATSSSPAAPAPAAMPSASSTVVSASPGYYYYVPAYGCYCYVPATTPAAPSGQSVTTARVKPAQPTPNATATANSGTYRSFSAEPGASTAAPYTYSYSATYGSNYGYSGYSYSSGGRSWGSRH